MKHFLLVILFFLAVQARGQVAGEWMSLPAVAVPMPAFSHTANVDGKTFTAAQLLTTSGLDVRALAPALDRAVTPSLAWQKAAMQGNTVTMAAPGETPAIAYHATYLSTPEWVSGRLVFHLHAPAVIYINGEEKTTYTPSANETDATREITLELLPGKHCIVVKTLLLPGKWDKLFSAEFRADEAFRSAPLAFTLSPKRGKTLLDILNGPRVSNLQASPSGDYLLLTRAETIGGKTTRSTIVYRTDTRELIYTLPGNTATCIAWVPGRDTLSYLLPEGEGHSLYTYSLADRELTRLFAAERSIDSYTWSPDGTYLLYYANEDHTDKDWELRDVDGMEDRQPYYRHRSFLCKYDLATGQHARLTWGNLTTYLQDISPDGRHILFATSRPDYDEYPYSKQNVYLLDARTLAVDTLWADRAVNVSCQFSPDGRQLLVQGAANAFGTLGLDIDKKQTPLSYDAQLFLYDLHTRQATPLTRDFNPSVIRAAWHRDGNIYFTANDTDYIRLFCLSPDGTIRHVECPGACIQTFTLASRGRQAFYLANDESYPARLYRLQLDNLVAEEWADPQGEQYRDIEFGQVLDWDYQYDKHTLIDGRYYLPADFDPTKKYPMIVYYYGGCTPVERTFGGRWPFNLYAANGYVVYVLQPSGAIGFGQKFSARHQHNWGRVTADEIIASVRAFLKAHPFVDPERVGCMGASYGGFTTMYLQTRTDLFACAISHAGISSITSYWGEGYWGYSYSTEAAARAFPWDRRDLYVDQSPLYNAHKVTTPMLLLHGTADVNVPTGESIQFYTALKLLGRDVHLVLIKGADHAVVTYDQRLLWGNTIMAYFAKYLKDQPAWWNSLYPGKNL